MKKTNLLIFAITLVIGLSYCLIGSITYAQTQTLTGKERSARIDIYSENLKFELMEVKSNGSVNFAQWLPKKENQKKSWIAQLGLGTIEPKSEKDKWQELWIEFTPADSGFVFIDLKGSYYPDLKVNHHEVWVDDVKIIGKDAVVQNGSFEEYDSEGNPVGWGWPEPSKYRYSTDGNEARTGKSCILVWHDRPVVQRIAVKARRRYRVSVWFKPYYAEVTPVEEEIF